MLNHKKGIEILLWVYLVGIALFLIPFTRAYFHLLVSLNILFAFVMLLLFHGSFTLRFLYISLAIIIASIGLEILGTNTGILFGAYQYASALGPKILNTPLLIGLNWLMLVYCCYVLLNRFKTLSIFVKALIGALLMTFYDFMMEPMAPLMSMWEFENNTVPLRNYIDWFIFSFLFLLLFRFTNHKTYNPLAPWIFFTQLGFFSILTIHQLLLSLHFNWIEYLTLFLFLFISIRSIVLLINFFSNPFLPQSRTIDEPKVSILIPARNEEKNIANLLNDLLTQDYSNYEIIVYDDVSTDHTASIIQTFIQKYPSLKLIQGQIPEKDWLGKNNACHQLALAAKGDYLLFLDADVRVGKGLIGSAIDYLKQKNLSLLSIFPKQEMLTTGEKITIPLMNKILLSMLPLIMIRWSKWTAFTAANGQFMLFDAFVYKNHYFHKKFKNEKVEDIAIARDLKTQGFAIATLLGDDRIRCRMYSGFLEATNGFSKNITHFFGRSFFITILYSLLISIALIVCALSGWRFLLVYLWLVLLNRMLVSRLSKTNIIEGIIFLFLEHFALLFVLFLAIRNKINGNYEWKGRHIK